MTTTRKDIIDARILIMGCLAILTQDMTFDWMELVSDTSRSTNHKFFYQFINWFREEYTTEWIKFPDTEESIAKLRQVSVAWFSLQNKLR